VQLASLPVSRLGQADLISYLDQLAADGQGVDERLAPARPVRHQARRWHLRSGVDAGQVAGEAAGSCHPACSECRHPARRWLRCLLCPGQRRLDRDRGRAAGVEVGDEAGQQPARLSQFVSERMPELQVVGEGLLEGAHRVVPGQGWATCRSAFGSTLA